MALKDLFKMTKADRYTADGCEELNKAREAATEDARPTNGIYHWKSGDYRKEGDKYVKIGPGRGGAGKTPQKENPTRSYSFEVGSNGMPKPGTGKQVQTFKTKKEAQKTLKKQNAAESKPAEARKDRKSSSSKQKLSENYKQEVKEFVASATPERIQRYIKALRTPFSIERDNFEEPDKLAAALETELKSKTENKPVEQMSIKELKEKRDVLKNGSGKENDLQYKKINDELAKKRLQKLSVGQEVKVDGKPVKITNINPDTNRVDIEFKSSDTGETMQSHIGLENIDNYESIGETESKPVEENYNDLHRRLTTLKPTSPELKNDFDDHRDILLKRVSRGEENFKEAITNYEKEMKASVPRMIENEIMTPEEGEIYMKAWEDFKKQAITDAAPRILTGDTKIRIKKETKDGVYTPQTINGPREKLERKLTGDCKVRVKK